MDSDSEEDSDYIPPKEYGTMLLTLPGCPKPSIPDFQATPAAKGGRRNAHVHKDTRRLLGLRRTLVLLAFEVKM